LKRKYVGEKCVYGIIKGGLFIYLGNNQNIEMIYININGGGIC
jgi:hypothetical protein